MTGIPLSYVLALRSLAHRGYSSRGAGVPAPHSLHSYGRITDLRGSFIFYRLRQKNSPFRRLRLIVSLPLTPFCKPILFILVTLFRGQRTPSVVHSHTAWPRPNPYAPPPPNPLPLTGGGGKNAVNIKIHLTHCQTLCYKSYTQTY